MNSGFRDCDGRKSLPGGDGMARAPLLSIATPVYNGAAHIGECIESVLKQEYTNWEYKVIDNASTDQTPEIVSRLASSDSRIRHVRFEEFVDANENHVRAFRAVDPASEFVKIVQAPDWIYPECLIRMVEAAQASETIGMVAAYQRSDAGVDLTGIPQDETFLDGRRVLRKQLLGEIAIIGGPTSLMFRTRFLRKRDPFYDGRYWHADHDAAFWMLAGHDLGFVHQVLMFERRQKGRIMEGASQLNTYAPEFICFLLRYGPSVLEPREYKLRLRACLRKYVTWHIRQLPRLSRMQDVHFFELHWTETERVLELGSSNAEVRAAVRFVRILLRRRARFCRITGPFALAPGAR